MDFATDYPVEVLHPLNSMEMIQRKMILLLFAFGLLLSSNPEVWAQERDKDKDKDKDKKEYKGKDYKEKSDKDKDKYKEEKRDKDDDRYENNRTTTKRSSGILGGVLGHPQDVRRESDRGKDDDRYKKDKRDKDDERYGNDRDNQPTQPTKGKLGGILGRVILPPAGTVAPRQLEGVPKGHYPPPGSCRIWYPNRPPGQQPPPTDCDNLRGARLEQGAFILHGDRAYDAEYDWREEERRRPGTVGRDILDILFPNRR